MFWFGFFVYYISTLVGYLMLKLSFQENSSDAIWPITWGYKKVHIFPKGISPKVNVKRNWSLNSLSIRSQSSTLATTPQEHPKFIYPVGWGCRKVRPPPPNEATCCPWMATCDAFGRDSGVWAVLDQATERSSYLQYITLAFTGLDGRSDWPDPINRLVVSSFNIYMFYPDRTFQSALAASSLPLSFRC